MQRDKHNIGVVLLNWNQYGDTARCLDSLRKSEWIPSRIVVFDNGSEDGSAEQLQREYPEIQLVRGESNLGFAEGNNRAARILLDSGVDLVWILNNDTLVPADCLGALVRALDEDPGIGAVSAKIWFMDPAKLLCYAGASFSRRTFNTYFRGLREPDAGQYDQAEDTEVLSGCCILVRAEILRTVGLFHRAFFAYSEDIEWSLRARDAGIRLRYEPKAILWHKMFGASRKESSGTIAKSSPRVEFLSARNRCILIRLHTKPWSLHRGLALGNHLFLRRLPRLLGLLLLKERRAAGWAGLQGLWAGAFFQPDPNDYRL